MNATEVLSSIIAEAPLVGTASSSRYIRRESRSWLIVEVVSTLAGLDAIAPDWLALERLSGATSVFQSYAHIRNWAKHFLSVSDSRQRLHVVVVRQGGRAVLIVPLVICRHALLRIARLAGEPVAQYSDVLIDPSTDLRKAFEFALASARRAGADAIILRRVREDSHLVALAGEQMWAGVEVNLAPYADFNSYENYEAYFQSLSKKMRQGLRNRQNHLRRAEQIEFKLFEGGAEAQHVLADAIGMKKKWLIQRGAISSAFLEPKTKECLLDLAAAAGETGAVVLRLLVNGEVAAIRFGFEYQGTHFAYMSAYDESFANLAPGKMLLEFYIRQFKERGLQRLDMLPPSGRHKTDWCRGDTVVADYNLPLTLPGGLYVNFYQERLRPALRRAWYRLPDIIRSTAAALFVGV